MKMMLSYQFLTKYFIETPTVVSLMYLIMRMTFICHSNSFSVKSNTRKQKDKYSAVDIK